MLRTIRHTALFWLACTTITFAQERPQIVTSGVGDVRIRPERADIQIGVVSQDSSAAAAARATEAKIRSIIDTLVSLGFQRDSLPTVDYRIGRNYYREGDSKSEAYRAESSIEVAVTDLEMVGQVIDAVLAAGANDIPTIRFDAAEGGTARRDAIAEAFAMALDDAQALADAAGGELGTLLELSTYTRGFPAIDFAAEQVELFTSITPHGIVRKVRVVAKWELLAP